MINTQEHLYYAAEKGDLCLIKDFLDRGGDVNIFDPDLGWTLLHFAAKEEHFAIVLYLLEKGADINARDENALGETPLGLVVSTCSFEMATLLIGAGANPIIPGWMKITALQRAALRKDKEGEKIFELLEKEAQNF